jgi:hypothetical protein
MRLLVPLTLTLALALPGRAEEAEAVPRAVVENPNLDLGRVVRGQTAEGIFRVRNLGAATLHIKQAKPG